MASTSISSSFITPSSETNVPKGCSDVIGHLLILATNKRSASKLCPSTSTSSFFFNVGRCLREPRLCKPPPPPVPASSEETEVFGVELESADTDDEWVEASLCTSSEVSSEPVPPEAFPEEPEEPEPEEPEPEPTLSFLLFFSSFSLLELHTSSTSNSSTATKSPSNALFLSLDPQMKISASSKPSVETYASDRFFLFTRNVPNTNRPSLTNSGILDCGKYGAKRDFLPPLPLLLLPWPPNPAIEEMDPEWELRCL
ncbi:hypothetical protein WICPIJ_008335 [Wickerhamomyces pijperi]|uniref:Uncharacterized protein n=1 Tax=Wickerhamomyces pijperi TaxID=599730 RepID=A0A9P8PXJ1_WICPI|nr:hypothetical protein WICPIJ_008335 [Wickerhamomyces pijperi]